MLSAYHENVVDDRVVKIHQVYGKLKLEAFEPFVQYYRFQYCRC